MSLHIDKQRWAELVAAGYTQAEACRTLKRPTSFSKDCKRSEECMDLVETLKEAKKVAIKVNVDDPKQFVVAELLARLEVAKAQRMPVKQRNGLQMKDNEGNLMWELGDTASILKILDQLSKVWKLYETTKVEVNVGFDEVMKLRQQALEKDQLGVIRN